MPMTDGAGGTPDGDREAFEAMLAGLLTKHAGKWAVVRDGELACLASTFDLACEKAARRFPDGRFYIAQVRPSSPPGL